MTTATILDFDRHPHIKYQDLSSKFWNEFTYRVLIRLPKKESEYATPVKFLGAMKRLEERIIDPECAPRRKNGRGFSYFFKDEGAARAFIDDNASLIQEVVRPRAAEDVSALEEHGIRRVAKANLFKGMYRFCVNFQKHSWGIPDYDLAEVDDWVGDYFEGSEVERYLFLTGSETSSKRVLYLDDFSDVIATKMSLHSFVTTVERCVLREEMPSATVE